MARRTSWRIPIFLNIQYRCGNKYQTATVTNISENGMLIDTDANCLSEGDQFEINLPLKEEDHLSLSVKVVRSFRSNNHCTMGVELLHPPEKYIDYVENLLFIL